MSVQVVKTESNIKKKKTIRRHWTTISSVVLTLNISSLVFFILFQEPTDLVCLELVSQAAEKDALNKFLFLYPLIDSALFSDHFIALSLICDPLFGM